MVEVGRKAPAFSLKDQEGKTHKLSDYAGKPLVIYFYPKDDTPGCTKETCEFRDRLPQLKKRTGGRPRRQHPRREEQGEVRAEVRRQLSAARRRRSRRRREIRRVAGEIPLRPHLHGHRADDVPHRQGRQGRSAMGQREGRRACGRRGGGDKEAVRAEVAKCGVRSPKCEVRSKFGSAKSVRRANAHRTSDFALLTPHSGLRTSDFARRTPHSGLRTSHSALRTPHSQLH